MSVSRRSFIGTSAAAMAAGLVAVGSEQSSAVTVAKPYTGKHPAAHLTVAADEGKLLLPKGFKAHRVGTIGVENLLDDRGGRVVGTTPSNLDGAGAFDYGRSVRLVRNHECRANADVPVPLVENTIYDDGVAPGMGGNTVVEVNKNGRLVQQWVALSGTIRNCAGGVTPWGSWLSCEEDLTRAGTKVTSSVDGQEYVTKKDHGYVFEVFPEMTARQVPVPIKAWGRAVWEGVSLSPDRTIAYLTEDTGDGLFYRWTAPKGKKMSAGIARQFGANDGVLQAAQLVKNGKALVHYGELTAKDRGRAFPVTWINGGADRQAVKTDLRRQYPGATVHPKIEGVWSDGEGVYFTLSYVNEAEAKKYNIDTDQGMVMYYRFKDNTMTLVEYWAKGSYFDSPDNITVSPWGGVVIAEDGSDPNHLVAWTPRRGSVALVKDIHGRGEWAGPAFNKSGSMLFGSVQSDCTYVITGPFAKYLKK